MAGPQMGPPARRRHGWSPSLRRHARDSSDVVSGAAAHVGPPLRPHRVRTPARARPWRDCLQPRGDRRGRTSDAVVVSRARSRNRLTHIPPRVGLLFVWYLVERGLVRLLRLGGLAFLLGALLLRLGMLPAALAAHL